MKTLFLLILMLVNSITVANVVYTETFDDYLGFGLQPGGGSGSLNSNLWRVRGLSDGDTQFGDQRDLGDSARGQSSRRVRSGGLYSFDIAGNPALGWQATGSDLTPGHLYLQIPNTTQTTWSNLWFSFELWYFNDQPRSTRVDFITNTRDHPPRAIASFTTPQASAIAANWQIQHFNISLGDWDIPGGGFGLFEWQLDDAGGRGSRDELAIDNLRLTRSVAEVSVVEGITTLLSCGIGLVLLVLSGNRRIVNSTS